MTELAAGRLFQNLDWHTAASSICHLTSVDSMPTSRLLLASHNLDDFRRVSSPPASACHELGGLPCTRRHFFCVLGSTLRVRMAMQTRAFPSAGKQLKYGSTGRTSSTTRLDRGSTGRADRLELEPSAQRRISLIQGPGALVPGGAHSLLVCAQRRHTG